MSTTAPWSPARTGAATRSESDGAPARTAAVLPTWVFGANGLLAGELLRLLEEHPGLALAGAVTRTGGEELRTLHPHLASGAATVDAEAAARGLAEAAGAGPALCVLALPHGLAATTWRDVAAELGPDAAHVVVLDLSADHRLRDAAAWAAWYGAPHPAPESLAAFVYALPELAGGELRGATRLAAPGCFATAMQLATVPAARAGVLDLERPWVHHAVTGSSGSGRTPSAGTHHPHRHGNLWAYAPEGHRHEAELLQAVLPLGLAPRVHLVPCSGPFVRGIHLTATLPLARPLSAPEAKELLRAAYAGAPFVEVLDGVAPDLHRVVGSNRAALSATVRDGLLRVTVTLDNVLKGGAGQALQALNVARGWPETAGLPRTSLGVL